MSRKIKKDDLVKKQKPKSNVLQNQKVAKLET